MEPASAAGGVCSEKMQEFNMDICNKMNTLLSSSTFKTTSDPLLSLTPLNEQFVSKLESVIEQCKVAINREEYEYIISHTQVLNGALSNMNNTVTMVIKQAVTDECDGRYRSSLCLLIESCFRVTKETFSLCKEVESNHTHSFDNLAGIIGPVFKTGFILLKTCSESIEYVCPPHLSNNKHHLIKVLSSLVAVSQFVLSFDPSLILLSWKALGKFVCHIKDHTHLFGGTNLKLSSVIKGMCDAMLAKSTECVNSAHRCDKEGMVQYNKLLKMCRFFATMIAKVVKEYSDFHYDLAADVVRFLFQLYEILPPSLSCAVLNNAQLSDVEANISVIIEPLVVSLLNCEQFLYHLTSSCFKSTTSRSFLSDLLLLCLVIKNYPKLNEVNRQFLLEPTSSQCSKTSSCRLLDAVVKCIEECSTELSLPVVVPGVVTGGNASYHVTLYEHIETHLCSVIAVLSPSQFAIVEQCLFQQLLFNDNFYCSLLVQDIWCFVARWGTSSLCYSHIKSLIKLIFAVGDKPRHTSGMKVRHLFSRLVAFTTSTQQCDLLSQYPPSIAGNLLIWSCVPYASLDPSVVSEICKAMYSSSSRHLLSLSVSPLTSYYCIQCLNGLLSDNTLKPHLPSPLSSELLGCLMNMLNGITVIKFTDNVIHRSIASSLLELISNLILQLNSVQLLEVFECLHTICSKPCSIDDDILVGVTHVLRQCSKLKTTNNVLNLLCACFKHLISHTHSWLVHNQALEAFKYFAEVTPHADILEGCIPASLNDTVVNYLRKIPPDGIKNVPLILSELIKKAGSTISEDHTSLTTPMPQEGINVIVLDDDEEISEEIAEAKCLSAVITLMEQWEKIKSNRESLTMTDKQQLTILYQELNNNDYLI